MRRRKSKRGEARFKIIVEEKGHLSIKKKIFEFFGCRRWKNTEEEGIGIETTAAGRGGDRGEEELQKQI